MVYKTHSARGFTLVEMLVVLAIVAVLLAIVLPSFSDARKNARDKKRMADMAQMQLALEVYFDIYGYFPREGSSYEDASGWVGVGEAGNGNITTILEPFMSEVPVDPLGPRNSNGYIYYYDGRHACFDSGGTRLDDVALLVSHVEDATKANTDDLPTCASWGGAGGTNDANAYIIVLGKSSG